MRLATHRLQAVIVNIVDVSYGGENGFNQVRRGALCVRL